MELNNIAQVVRHCGDPDTRMSSRQHVCVAPRLLITCNYVCVLVCLCAHVNMKSKGLHMSMCMWFYEIQSYTVEVINSVKGETYARPRQTAC